VRVEPREAPARRLRRPDTVDADRLIGLHALAVAPDERIGRRDDVRAAAVVLDQIVQLGGVVLLEPPDVLDAGAAEGVDVLVVVADGEQREPGVLAVVLQGAPGDGAHQPVLLGVDVLVLVHQDVPVAGQQLLAGRVRGNAQQRLPALQQVQRLGQHGVEVRDAVVAGGQALGIGMPGEAHREAVVGLHRHMPGVVAHQRREPPAQRQRRAAAEAEHQDAVRRHPQHPQQIGTAMHDDPRLAGTGAGQHQPVAILRGGDDLGLRWVPQRIHDAREGFGRGRAGQHLAPVAEEAPDEFLLAEREVARHQGERLADLLGAELGVTVHDVDLEHALAVMLRERLILRLGVAPALSPPAAAARSWRSGTRPGRGAG